MFDNYLWRGSKLVQYSLYDDFKLVNIVSNKTDKYIPFAKNYLQFSSLTQKLCSVSLCKIFVTLVGPLSINKATKNTIQRGHLDTNAWQNDVGMILLSLFVS